jgi:hypothetical protein
MRDMTFESLLVEFIWRVDKYIISPNVIMFENKNNARDALVSYVQTLEVEVSKLREDLRWILSSNRLPENTGWYPVWTVKNSQYECQKDMFFRVGTGWLEDEFDGYVYCWRYPLPQPPEVE